MDESFPNMLEAALALLERGMSVIPVHSPAMALDKVPEHMRKRVDPENPAYSERDVGKIPLLTTWDKYQKDPPTEAEVRKWWGTLWPDANIAVVCGGVSDIFVMDADGPEGVDFLGERGVWLGMTLTSQTGRGYHFVFKHPGTPVKTNFRITENLDVKADGGYVIVPPSLHRLGGRYEWFDPDAEPIPAPEWLLDHIRKHNAAPSAESRIPKGELDTLMQGARTGQRHESAMRLAGHYLGLGLSLQEVERILLAWNRSNQPPGDEAHILKEIRWAWEQEQAKRRDPEAFEIERLGDNFMFTWPAWGLAIGLSNFQEERGRPQSDVTIRSSQGDIYHWGSLVLPSTSGRTELVRKLRDVRNDINWAGLLEQVCRIATEKYREGGPVIELVPSPSPLGREFIRRFMPAKETTILFGDGGAGKSSIALAMAIAATQYKPLPSGLAPWKPSKVLYLDWESNPEEHKDRLAALLRGYFGLTEAPGIYYRRMTKPISAEIAFIRSEIARIAGGMDKIDEVLVIGDSYTPMAGRDPEGADAANAVMSALHAFGPATRLLICHVSKEAAERQGGAGRPWGSVFLPDLARSVWEVRVSNDPDISGNFLQVRFNHRKVNRGRRYPPFEWRLDYQNEKDAETDEERTVSITISPGNSQESMLATAPERVITYLAHHAMGTTSQIAAYYDMPLETVRKAVQRLKRVRRIVKVDETDTHEDLYALAAPKGLDEPQTPPEGTL